MTITEPERVEMSDDESHQSDGNTIFLRAARDGNLNDVLEYLKGSTDINTSNPNGLNALHLASKEGHLNIVTELLKRGANVEAATKKGNTALHIASLAGHEQIVMLLVEYGAKINIQAQSGFTPLYMASQEGHAEVVKFLLANGASQGLATVDGFTPLAVALQQGHEKVVTVLLEHDTKGKVRLPALHIAAKKDDVRAAIVLLQNEQTSVDTQTKSGFTPLHIASHYGNVNVGTYLIERGADVNFKAKNNITPLHVASRWGKANMVTCLLDAGAAIDERTRDGLTPLHCAARSGHENVVDLLLERGAPYSAKTKNGLTPLHMSAQGDHVDCARLLLYHKAPVDDVTVDYLTPLHVAAHCGNVKTAKLLLDRKCDPNTRALNGFTPLHIACKKNRIKVVELLLKFGASIEATTESGLTPLHVASFMGHMNIVIYLIQHSANPDYPTVRGETALHLAARANQTDIIRILLRNSASVDARAREQQTPLHIAARLGNVDNVVLLLQHGASADAVTKDLYTPLHIAAKEGHEEVASVLLDQGASHDLTTKKGFTPLHIAAKYGNIKVARLLLQKDANPDVQGKNGLTPLHVATHYNHVNVALLLLDHKASPHSTAKNGYTPLHIAAKKNQMDIATTLLEFGGKPDSESKNGYTPLHLAAQEGHTDMVSLLLEHKASVSAKSHNGLTPLHLAAQEDKVNVAEILVKYSADIDPQTKAGYTPLHTACHFGQINMVRFLLEREASVSSTTKMGYTPLHQAAQQGHVMVVNLLLKNNASPNAVTNNGQTALDIAQRLGYISVVETLKPVTEVTQTMPATDDKYKVVSPETMQETLISDSEDEGGDDSLSLERGDSTSPLDTSYDKDVALRYRTAEDPRSRMTSEIGDAMRYPSYLERGPDYEAEMKYFSGDTLSPRDKIAKSRNESVFSGDYSTLDRLDQEALKESELHIRSVDENTNELEYDDDFRYTSDDIALKKDYLEASVVGQSYSAAPDNRYTDSKRMDTSRISSYSGSSFNTSFDPDNVAIDRAPVYSGFLVSFMVDARGGAMRGCRHSGVRFIIPPRKASMPTRVTCRLIKKEKLLHPPPLNEGEGLAARILEMGPVGTKFLGPIIIEVPHFASLRGKEREIVILRSDNGEHWTEHPMVATEKAVNEALGGSVEGQETISLSSLTSLWKLDHDEELNAKRITRILTDDFPQYFAIVSRIRQGNQLIGEEGGVISSTVVPQVQAVFPEGALTKPIKVGLQAQPVSTELIAKLLGNRVAVSPIVTVEPRRRKFHKAITLTIPVPKAAQKGMINQYGGEAPTLRLLCSIAGGSNAAVWEDLTTSKPLTFVNDCVSFTTTVSARFWLMDCQNVGDAARMATELYKEAITVPYMAKFVVFAKRTATEEGKLRMFCMTDDKVDKTLERQEHFIEVARSRDVEVLQGRHQFVEMAGNLIPVTKSGDQLSVNFRAFRENRVPCTVRIRDLDQEPAARVAFMREPKVGRGEVPQSPICNLNVTLPDMSKSSSMEMDGDAALEVRKRHSLLREHGIVLQDTISRAQMRLTDVADTLQGDWVILAQQLDITIVEINKIKTDYNTVNDQALAMLQLWVEKNKEKATGNALEKSLIKINREDVARKCMFNVETFEDEVEAAAARVAMDQSGFDTFKEEVGITSDSSMKRGMSLDVQYDEQDMIKESESAAEESSTSEGDAMVDKVAPQAVEEGDLHIATSEDDQLIAEVDDRRPVAKTESPETIEMAEKRKEAYFDLINDLEMLEDQEAQQVGYEDTEDRVSVAEDEIVHSKHEKAQPTDVLAKVEVFGVKAELGVAVSKEKDAKIDDEEGVKTPPPSPVEKDVATEETPQQETDVDEVAAILATQEHVEAEESEPKMPEFLIREQELDKQYDQMQATERHEEQITEGVDRDQISAPVTKVKHEAVDEPEMELDEMEGLMSKIDEVFGSDIPAGESVYEEVQPDGTIIKHRHIREQKHRVVFDSTGNECVEFIEEEGPPHEETKIEEKEEILPDGTVHTVQTVRKHSVQHVRKSLLSEKGDEEDIFEGDVEVPGSKKEDIIETFDEPPHSVLDIEDVDKVLPDGTTVKRRVMMNRMVHHIKTHHESFDDSGKVEDEEYEIEEIIPGTETAFYADDSSSLSSIASGSSEDVNRMEADIDETEEYLEDGTIITKTNLSKEETHRVHSRSGSIDETLQTTLISEEKVTPSPRSRSPVGFEQTGEGDVIKSGEHLERVIKKTIKEGHFEAELHGDVLERSSEMVQHNLFPKLDKAIEEQQDQPEWRELEDSGLVKRSVKKVSYVPRNEEEQRHSSQYEDETFQTDPYRQTYEPEDFQQTTFSSSSSSSERAQRLDEQVADSNTFSTLSSEVGDQDEVAELAYQSHGTQLLIGEENQKLMSSYENVYDGVPLDPEINRLSMDASQLEIGDRFDTKQPDTHLHPAGKTSSYEQLYEEDQSEVAEEDHATGIDVEEDRLSSSSSEVAQVEDVNLVEGNISDLGDMAAGFQTKADQRRIASIDDDDTTEYDINEHSEDLAHGIPDRFAQKPAPEFIGPEYDDSDDDEILDFSGKQQQPVEEPEGAEGGEDDESTRLMMKKQIHKKTIVKDGQEQTFILEETRVHQDNDPPEELRDSMQQIIDEFMGAKPDAEKKPVLEDEV